eukprot:6043838-Alexandrium_andersonii.AAC.1
MGMTSLDTSQCVTRMAAGHGEILETVTPSSRVVLFPPVVPKLRGLTGFESMTVIGMPTDFLHGFAAENLNSGRITDANMDNIWYNMAGNAFNSGVFAAIMISLLLHMSPDNFKVYDRDVDEESDDAIDQIPFLVF